MVEYDGMMFIFDIVEVVSDGVDIEFIDNVDFEKCGESRRFRDVWYFVEIYDLLKLKEINIIELISFS